MTSISQNQRYIPHELNTKYYATNYIEMDILYLSYVEDIKYLNHH